MTTRVKIIIASLLILTIVTAIAYFQFENSIAGKTLSTINTVTDIAPPDIEQKIKDGLDKTKDILNRWEDRKP